MVTKIYDLFSVGITDIEIHFLQVKFTAIGVYLDPSDVKTHLDKWKGKTGKDLAGDDDFFDALASGKLNQSILLVVYFSTTVYTRFHQNGTGSAVFRPVHIILQGRLRKL